MVTRPQRGEVYWAGLDPVVGSEQGGTRPVVIVQSDVGNERSATTIVVPLMSAVAKSWYRVNVQIPDGVLKRRSVAKCSQIRTLDKARLLPGPIAMLGAEVMARIDEALRVSLGMY